VKYGDLFDNGYAAVRCKILNTETNTSESVDVYMPSIDKRFLVKLADIVKDDGTRLDQPKSTTWKPGDMADYGSRRLKLLHVDACRAKAWGVDQDGRDFVVMLEAITKWSPTMGEEATLMDHLTLSSRRVRVLSMDGDHARVKFLCSSEKHTVLRKDLSAPV